jgi:hypothetical protein
MKVKVENKKIIEKRDKKIINPSGSEKLNGIFF